MSGAEKSSSTRPPARRWRPAAPPGPALPVPVSAPVPIAPSPPFAPVAPLADPLWGRASGDAVCLLTADSGQGTAGAVSINPQGQGRPGDRVVEVDDRRLVGPWRRPPRRHPRSRGGRTSSPVAGAPRIGFPCSETDGVGGFVHERGVAAKHGDARFVAQLVCRRS
ncbi:MAG: hypothetical protein FVQ78_10785 [Solirubrobacterales bacterium]|nr:hypothetical protein [Solirubrobacterales bacterium]